jgi:NADH-quinone oxidoreductase subunit C
LLSIKDESRLRLRLLLRTLYTPSIQNIYPNSNWLEREVFDLYGILFLNHPDLRRILTDYGFEFYPLRKDFPLSGYTEVRFDEELGQMVTEPVNLSQDFRVYNFLNP